jgi:ketosteroid isomerase-like protein
MNGEHDGQRSNGENHLRGVRRGDVETILDKLDDAVEWETTVPVPDVPWLQARRGKANVVGFFESLAPLKIIRFEPHTLFDDGDKVFALIVSTFRSRARTTRSPITVASGSATQPARPPSTTTSPTPLR